MFTINSTSVCELPVSPKEVRLERGNAVLVRASDMQPIIHTYQQAGLVHEGACITSCDDTVLAVLEQLQLRFCPWPDEGFTLVVLGCTSIGIIADRLVMAPRNS